MEHAGTQPAPIQRAVVGGGAGAGTPLARGPAARPAPQRRRAVLAAARLRAGDRGGWLALWLRAPFASAARRSARREAFEARAAARLAATLGSLKGPFVEGRPVRREPPRPAAGFGDHAARRAARPGAAPPVPGGARRGRARARRAAGDALRRVRARAARARPRSRRCIARGCRAAKPWRSRSSTRGSRPRCAADLAWVRRGLARLRAPARPPSIASGSSPSSPPGCARSSTSRARRASRREIAENLAHDPRVVVPRVLPSHSSRRVLTMSYAPAVRVDDRAGPGASGRRAARGARDPDARLRQAGLRRRSVPRRPAPGKPLRARRARRRGSAPPALRRLRALPPPRSRPAPRDAARDLRPAAARPRRVPRRACSAWG